MSKDELFYICDFCGNRWSRPAWHKCVERYGKDIFKTKTLNEIELEKSKSRVEDTVPVEETYIDIVEDPEVLEAENSRMHEEVVARWAPSAAQKASKHVEKFYREKPELYQAYIGIVAWLNRLSGRKLRYISAKSSVTIDEPRLRKAGIQLFKTRVSVSVPIRRIDESFRNPTQVRDYFLEKGGRVFQTYLAERSREGYHGEGSYNGPSRKRRGPFEPRLR